jgi:hypothetical protein
VYPKIEWSIRAFVFVLQEVKGEKMTCRHFPELVTSKGAKLSHSDRVETQIEIGQGLSAEQLLESAKRPKEPLGLLLAESLIFFALLYRETYLGVDLANVLFDRMYVRFQGRYGREKCHELNQELWAQIIDPRPIPQCGPNFVFGASR